jgi:hypothetical protein
MPSSGCQLTGAEIEELASRFAKELTICELTRTSGDFSIDPESVVTTYFQTLDSLLDQFSEQNAKRTSVY